MARRSSAALTALLLAAASCTVFDDLRYAPDGGGSSTSSAPAAILADRPIALWRFEDGTSAIARDSSGRGNDCEYIGSIARERPSAAPTLGNAIDFDGVTKAFVQCRDAPFDFATNAPFTVEAWIHARKADSTYRKVFSKDVTGERAGWNLSVVEPNRVRFETYAVDEVTCEVTAPIAVGAWAHVVATYDAASVHLYVDGGAVHERKDCTRAVPMPDSAVPLTLGAQSDGRYGFFDGLVDELAIYDRALAADRIAAHRDAAR